jgi:hypothetical protein
MAESHLPTEGPEFMTQEDSGGLVKAAISGTIGAALGIMITYSTGVASNRTEIVRLATKVDNLTNTIEVNMTDRYRGADAARDFSAVREKMAEIISHDAMLEAEIKEHIRNHEKIR